jgi:L-alanine-DL-glutamate epimerase-like enolase superfamily enzyme
MSLSSHRIADVARVTVRCISARNVGRNAIGGNHGDGHDLEVLVVTTDRGATGWGHVVYWHGQPPAAGWEQALVGRNLAELFDPQVGVIAPEARPLDVVLHDLAGRILDLPVYAMLGAAGGRDVPLYSGGIYFDDLDPEEAPAGPDAIRRNLQTDYVLGHRDFKLKIGRGHRWIDRDRGMALDIEATRLARELYPEARIMVDANTGYAIDDVEEFLTATADCDLYWLEQMLPVNDPGYAGMRPLVDRLTPRTLIGDGEDCDDSGAMIALHERGLLDVAQMDVIYYGVTPWREAMPTFAAIGIGASPHTWGTPLSTYYVAHLAAGLGNVEVVEAMPAIVRGVDAGAYHFSDGVLRVPDAPGFGLTLR